MIRIIICFIILTSCKTSQKCEAYSEVEFDIHKQQQLTVKKYVTVETITTNTFDKK